MHEVATVVRVSLALWGGRIGPGGYGNVFKDTLFVRDADFIQSLAADLKVDAGELYRELREAADEGGERRRRRAEALVVAEKVCGSAAQVRKNHPDRWRYFQKIVQGQRLNSIVRGIAREERGVVRASCAWCSGRIREMVGDEELDKVLTFRNILG